MIEYWFKFNQKVDNWWAQTILTLPVFIIFLESTPTDVHVTIWIYVSVLLVNDVVYYKVVG